MTSALAAEVAEDGILGNCVAPAWLAAPENAYMSGQAVMVDGGFTGV